MFRKLFKKEILEEADETFENVKFVLINGEKVRLKDSEGNPIDTSDTFSTVSTLIIENENIDRVSIGDPILRNTSPKKTEIMFKFSINFGWFEDEKALVSENSDQGPE